MTTPQCDLMRRLMVANFSIDDVKLFLDTHPDCALALDYYCKTREARNQLLQEYECQYGPITADAVNSLSHWTWVDSAWPWEREAN